jgi:hypothetical protein
MALTPEDRAFYEEKLGLKGLLYLLIATVLVGAIAWPLLFYVQDYSTGQTSKWSFLVVRDFAFTGAMFGSILAAIMFAAARFYLWMGWLPRRR